VDWLTGPISDWFQKLLTDGILSNFSGMFGEINTRVGEIANQVGQTPAGFHPSIFRMVRNLSETVIMPIAGMVLTFILCHELIRMVMEKNNMADLDVWGIFKWIFKSMVAVVILSHTFDLVMGIFELAQHVIQQSAGIVQGSLNLNLALDGLAVQMESMETGELLGLYLESAVLSLAMKAISLCIFLIIYGRMIEIYLVCSLAPIPLSTLADREWGQIGNNYLKSLFALAFQGFLIMVCVAIYAALLQSITLTDNIHSAIWGCAGYTVLLCFSLFKTGSLSKAIFGTH
jgi:hypothetical protein